MRNTFLTILLIVVAFGLGLSANKKEKVVEPQTQIVETEEKEEIPSMYESPFGFSFDYEGLQLENSNIFLPGGYRVFSIAAVRYVKEQYCNASGLSEHCRAFFENPAIAFGVMDISFEDFKEQRLKDVFQFSEPITLAGREALQYYQGVEGEGVVTIALPLKETQTLLIQYTFDEFINSMSDKGDLLDSQEQKRIADRVLSTLKID